MDLTVLKHELQALGIPVPDDIPFEEWAERLTANPTRNLATLLAISTVAFYLLEKKSNPKVNDIWDSLVYTTTCLSVGYGDIFAKSAGGKIIGSALMTVGPHLSGIALDPPRPAPAPAPAADAEVQKEILETLKRILDRLDTMAPAKAV